MEPQQRHLGKPLFYGITETGPVNSFVHIWVYADAADRAEKRAAMQADPEWIEYVGMSTAAGNLVSQENKLMVEAPFFKLS